MNNYTSHGVCRKCQMRSLPTQTLSVSVGTIFQSVRLFVCLFVCRGHNSKTNDPKVFKRGIVNDLGISYKRHGFGLKGQKLTAIWRGF